MLWLWLNGRILKYLYYIIIYSEILILNRFNRGSIQADWMNQGLIDNRENQWRKIMKNLFYIFLLYAYINLVSCFTTLKNINVC